MNEFKVDFVWDISIPNSVYNFDSMPDKEALGIAAFSFFYSRVRFNKQEKIDLISFFIDSLFSGLDGWNVRLYLSNRSWQPNTKLMRYKGFARRLGLQKRKCECEISINEQVYDSADGIKFLVDMDVSTITSQSIAELILDEINNYLVVFPNNINPDRGLVRPIEDDFLKDYDFFRKIFEKNGVIIRKIGAFDDPEIGFVGFGNPELCCQIAKEFGLLKVSKK